MFLIQSVWPDHFTLLDFPIKCEILGLANIFLIISAKIQAKQM